MKEYFSLILVILNFQVYCLLSGISVDYENKQNTLIFFYHSINLGTYIVSVVI
jgi:hypothetical protein